MSGLQVIKSSRMIMEKAMAGAVKSKARHASSTGLIKAVAPASAAVLSEEEGVVTVTRHH